MSNPGIVQGIPLSPGELPGIRQELRDFKRSNADLWNLYLVGLRQFQRVAPNDAFSYFQIAGIHGQPYQEWPRGDPKILNMRVPNQTRGFCTHSSILFLTWHRPYLALFESTLYKHINATAAKFTDPEGKSRYVAAAKSFRMPYWDWARGDLSIFPDEAFDRRVQVVIPASMRREYEGDRDNKIISDSGKLVVEIANPLYAYSFPDGTPDSFKINGQQTTQRYAAVSGTNIDPQQRKDALLAKVREFRAKTNRTIPVEANLTERVIYLVQSYNSFKGVSHNRFDTSKNSPNNKFIGYGSIEDIHNTLHVDCGGDGIYRGHMGNVAIAAFDPIFWLHHTNIDRIFSIWQGLHDFDGGATDRYVTDQINGEGTFVTKVRGIEKSTSPLVPFYRDNTNFWDSDTARYTSTFGYVYPETQNPQKLPGPDYRKAIVQELKRRYPAGSFADLIRRDRAGSVAPARMLAARAQTLAQVTAVKAPTSAATLIQLMSQTAPKPDLTAQTPAAQVVQEVPKIEVPHVEIRKEEDLKKLVPADKYLEWLVNIKAEKHALDGKFTVHVFLGPVEETDPALYPISPNHVGTFSTFGSDRDTECDKCKEDQANDQQVTGQIPLTIALAERFFAHMVGSLQPNDVSPYLQENLHWRVISGDGTVLNDRSQIPGLLIAVISNEVHIPTNETALPVYSPNVTVRPEITTKADGSAGRGEGTGYTGQPVA